MAEEGCSNRYALTTLAACGDLLVGRLLLQRALAVTPGASFF